MGLHPNPKSNELTLNLAHSPQSTRLTTTIRDLRLSSEGCAQCGLTGWSHSVVSQAVLTVYSLRYHTSVVIVTAAVITLT